MCFRIEQQKYACTLPQRVVDCSEGFRLGTSFTIIPLKYFASRVEAINLEPV